MGIRRSTLLPLLLKCILFTTGCFALDAEFLQDVCVADLQDAIHVNGFLCKDSALVTSADFIFSGFRPLEDKASNVTFAASLASVFEFPALNSQGLSMLKASFAPGAVAQPHSHPRSSELLLVLKGRVYVGFVTTGNKLYSAVLSAGDMFLVPKGLVHFQMNVAKVRATLVSAFNSQNPGFQGLPSALFGTGIKDEVLLQAFGLSNGALAALKSKFKTG